MSIVRLTHEAHSSARFDAGRGRRTSSPAQLGQIAAMACVQVGQNVHSYVQMYASSVGASAAPQRSQTRLISNGIDILQEPRPHGVVDVCSQRSGVVRSRVSTTSCKALASHHYGILLEAWRTDRGHPTRFQSGHRTSFTCSAAPPISWRTLTASVESRRLWTAGCVMRHGADLLVERLDSAM
jgi:hypothetical protein